MSVRHTELAELTPEQMRVHRAGEALHRDGANPSGALELLAAIVEDRTWERLTDARGRPFSRFRDFVEARQPHGLGYDVAELPKVLRLRHPGEAVPEKAARMAAMRAEIQRLLAEEIPEAAPRGGDRRSDEFQTRVTSLNQSDTADAIVSRLKKKDPDLAARVIAGELTPNAAAREKGWRKPRIVVTSPERIAQALIRHMDPDDITRLVDVLTEHLGAS